MVKSKTSNRKKEDAPEAVLNLTIDGSFADAQVRETVPPPADAFQTPCSVNGIMAGISGGTLGYAFGFGKKTFSFIFLIHAVFTKSITLPKASYIISLIPNLFIAAGYWFSNRLKGNFRASLGSGWASAKVCFISTVY